MVLFKQINDLLHLSGLFPELLACSRLEGGISARVFLLEVSLPGGSQEKWVLRQYGQADLDSNPHIARDEFHLLQILQKSDLPVARPIAFEENPDHPLTPCLILEYLPGETNFSPRNLKSFLQQAAENLWKIHNTDLSAENSVSLPQAKILAKDLIFNNKTNQHEQPFVEKVRQKLQKHWPFHSDNPSVLLHGDYWPGNLLWLNGQLSGIIDWEDARLGDPLADLANARLEFLWAFGWQAMLAFTENYMKISSINPAHLAYWDAVAALRHIGFEDWDLPDTQKQKMRIDLEGFISCASEKIGKKP